MTKEQSVTTKVMKVFPNEKISRQRSVLTYQIDLYFSEHKLALEVDEKVHKDRNIYYEIKRQKAIEKELGCEFIRINPDVKDYDEYAGIEKIYNQIIESTKKLTEESNKKSLIDQISKRLLELEFKSNHSIKSKCLEFIVKKNIAIIIKHANLLFKL